MQTNAWQYDELQQVGVDYQDFHEVEKYDARMQKLRDIPAEIDKLLTATEPTASSNILEIGCGTGEFTIAMAKVSKSICAVDVSPLMLEYAGEKATAQNITNIDFHHAGFLTFQAEPVQFDIVYSQLALHHLPDFWKQIALNNVFSLLKKGGKFFLKDVVYSSDTDNYNDYFNDIIAGYEESAGPEFTEEILTHIQKEYSTLDWIMEGLLRKADFRILENTMEHGFIATYLCTK